MKKPQFIDGHIYHVYNRGVKKRKVFLDTKDHLRFVHDLFELNDEQPVGNVLYYFNPKSMEVEPHYIQKERTPRKLLVEILAFVLMPNHYHLLLRQKRENGIVRFMQKLGTGYTMYFNKKYERVGPLFQGRFKGVLVHRDAHFIYLPHYIHLNPLELKYGGLTSIDTRKALNFLREYRWSSFPDYVGKKNFPSVTSRNFLLEYFGGEEKYLRDSMRILRSKQLHWDDIQDVIF